jgi:indolepyruvate ferredoxin oxidoreductase alpha subunit
MKKILQGNEAIARGAWEAGVAVGCAYPGTPSSEIMAELSRYKEVYTEWSPNEKVAVEVAHGASCWRACHRLYETRWSKCCK